MNRTDFDQRTNWFTLTFPFDDQTLAAQVAEIPGSKWFGPNGCWVAPKASAAAVLAWSRLSRAQVEQAALDAIQDMEQFEANVDKSKAKKPICPGQNYGVAVELFDYQKAGVEYILGPGGGRTIIGDEMGVGKTLQAIAAIHANKAFPAVIICPASLKINWKREIQAAAPGTTIEILRGSSKAQPRLWHADWTIVNYDILEAWEDCLPKQPAAVVADESHYIMNPKINRTKSTLRIFARVPEDGIRLCMSGTPVLNKTRELMTQIEAVGALESIGTPGHWKGRGRELNRQLRGSGWYMRRLKADVWKDAPGRRWAPFIVEGDPAAMKEYRRAEKNIVKWLAQKASEQAREQGATTREAQAAAWQAMYKAQAAEILVQFTYLKQLAAHAKMPAVNSWIQSFMQQPGEKLAAFAWHSEIVDEVVMSHPKLQALSIVGGQTERQRQRAVDQFQDKDGPRLLVGQIKAAGVGLTLTAASNVLLIEQGWTPGAHDQVLDRCHRRGQENNVVGWVPLCEGTIDEDIHQLVEAKRAVVDDAVDGYDRTGGADLETDVIQQLAEKYRLRGIASVTPGE